MPTLRSSAGVALMMIATGCASGGTADAAASGVSGGSAGEAEDGSESATGPNPRELGLPEPHELDAILAAWESMLEDGPLEGTGRAFQAVARFRDHGEAPERTLWGLALVHLLPESPLVDRDRGREHLTVLEEHFPTTWEGTQARMLQTVFRELDRATTVAEEGDRLIRELSETVEHFQETMEQLKRIDLNRRPVRDNRSDTLPRRRPPD